MAVPYGVDLAYRARARSVLTAQTRLAQTRLYISLAMKGLNWCIVCLF